MSDDEKARKAAYQKAWRQRQSPEKQEAIREQIRRWYYLHQTERKIANREYHNKNRDRDSQRDRARREVIHKNPELYARFRERARIHKRERIRGIVMLQWDELIEDYNNACAYCLMPFSPTNIAEPDHVMPVKLGGPKNIHNIVPACRECNLRKGQKSVVRFLIELWGFDSAAPL